MNRNLVRFIPSIVVLVFVVLVFIFYRDSPILGNVRIGYQVAILVGLIPALFQLWRRRDVQENLTLFTWVMLFTGLFLHYLVLVGITALNGRAGSLPFWVWTVSDAVVVVFATPFILHNASEFWLLISAFDRRGQPNPP